ncbi:MAG: putative toxin-antitoxin system toxin component, PIN family [Chloroflexota bacterium]|nr:putative toxin-antitoxin system toxin component, PIN family [Chloroflexota bacterium]
MIFAVFDTNVLASGTLGLTEPKSTPGELLRRWRARAFQLIVSDPILVELTATLASPYFIRRLTPAEIEDGLTRLRVEARRQPIITYVAGVAAHSEDDVIIATALSAGAPFLVTGDKALLKRDSYQGTRILTPRQFLTVPDSEPGRSQRTSACHA